MTKRFEVVWLTTADVTLNSGLRRLDLHLPDEASEIKRGRWRMVGYVSRSGHDNATILLD